MNFIFISPAFPTNYYNFCDRLKNNKANVLGIGDTPYDELTEACKNSLTEYYKVNSLENYDEVFRAVAFFSFKYGKIDYLESNNEYWLKQDARLRADFNIDGAKPEDVVKFTSKSKMKESYKLAGVKTARYKFCTCYSEDLEFIHIVGFPVIVKPDVGVGAYATYRLKNEEDLTKFYSRGFSVPYIIEEYITGDIISFDGVCDEDSNVVFSDNEVFPPSVMDVVNENLELPYYVEKEMDPKLFDIGCRVLKAFNIKKRFFHLEFFKLTKDKEGFGKVGDIVALEVNMRPPGGFTPDLINYSQSVDTYQIYADIMCFNRIVFVDLRQTKYYCMYIGRRDRFSYYYTSDEVKAMYKEEIVMNERMSSALASALGNEFFMAKFIDKDKMLKFKDDVLKHKE